MHASHSSRQAAPGRQSSTAASADSGAAPIVTIDNGAVRGLIVPGGYVFRGLPYAAPPTGDLRWRPPRPPAAWQGVRDATRFAPSSPQPPNAGLTGPASEDCLYNVTVAGQSSGGLSVLAHMISRGSRGLFRRAIVQSGVGPWALEQKSLAAAEADGEAFAAKAGSPDQTAESLRRLPVADLVSNFPGAAVPAVVDGEVLEEPIGTALAAGRFARVPILNGTIHDEERVFISAGVAVTGAVVRVPEVTAENYQRVIASVLDVPAARAAAIAAEYPLEAYPSPTVALSALVGDASFACPALQPDLWTSKYVPTFGYEFNDDRSRSWPRPGPGPAGRHRAGHGRRAAAAPGAQDRFDPPGRDDGALPAGPRPA
jgi:carboxylesterase type B